MKDPTTIDLVDQLKEKIKEVNTIMSSLNENNVEVRLQYKFEDSEDKKPTLSIWRCVGHDDYL